MIPQLDLDKVWSHCDDLLIDQRDDRLKLKHFEEALKNYDAAKVTILYFRGGLKINLGLFQDALEDLDEALGSPGIFDDAKVDILQARGFIKNELGQYQEAIDDLTAALAVPGVTDEMKEIALRNRDFIKEKLDNLNESPVSSTPPDLDEERITQ